MPQKTVLTDSPSQKLVPKEIQSCCQEVSIPAAKGDTFPSKAGSENRCGPCSPLLGVTCWQDTLCLAFLNSRQPVTLRYCFQFYILVLNYFLWMLFLNWCIPWGQHKPLDFSSSLAVITAATRTAWELV